MGGGVKMGSEIGEEFSFLLHFIHLLTKRYSPFSQILFLSLLPFLFIFTLTYQHIVHRVKRIGLIRGVIAG